MKRKGKPGLVVQDLPLGGSWLANGVIRRRVVPLHRPPAGSAGATWVPSGPAPRWPRSSPRVGPSIWRQPARACGCMACRGCEPALDLSGNSSRRCPEGVAHANTPARRRSRPSGLSAPRVDRRPLLPSYVDWPNAISRDGFTFPTGYPKLLLLPADAWRRTAEARGRLLLGRLERSGPPAARGSLTLHTSRYAVTLRSQSRSSSRARPAWQW